MPMRASSFVFLFACSSILVGPAMAASDQPPPLAQGLSGVAAASISDQTTRYMVPYYTSQTSVATGRTISAVTIYNYNTAACSVFVSFQFGTQTTSTCLLVTTIPARTSAQLCSRPVSDPVMPCTVSCPSGGLIRTTGHALIGSSKVVAGCDKISVDARTFYTSGSDSNLLGSSKLTVVKISGGNIGD